MINRFANPARFMRLSARGAAVVRLGEPGVLALGLYLALFVAPPDYQQGEAVRIMYVHVPAAWLALSGLSVRRGGERRRTGWRHPLADDRGARGGADRRRASPSSAWSPARCGAGRCGAPGGCGTRG